MTSIAVVYYSGYGHTTKLAEAILKGINGKNAQLIAIDENGDITASQWQALDSASAIVMGSPTYMGTVSWQFKKFADASSKQWFSGNWKNKIAAGFTNSASMNGDKATTLNYLMTFALQHAMVWVGNGEKPSAAKSADRNDVNYLGAYTGLMAQSPSDASPEEGPLPGDLKTAHLFGKRISDMTQCMSTTAMLQGSI